jgi:hypothetical protein
VPDGGWQAQHLRTTSKCCFAFFFDYCAILSHQRYGRNSAFLENTHRKNAKELTWRAAFFLLSGGGLTVSL